VILFYPYLGLPWSFVFTGVNGAAFVEFDVWFAGYSYVESPSFCATVSMALCDIKIVKCLVTICDVHERINDVPTVHIC
jgi:hypothetical protein